MTRADLIVLGRLLGTFAEWDACDDREEYYDGFIPAPGVDLPACDRLFINYETGDCIAEDAEGTAICNADLAQLCASLSRR